MASRISLSGIAQRNQRALDELGELAPLAEEPQAEEIMGGKITAAFRENETFLEYTGYNESQVRAMVEEMSPVALRERTRGPAPRSSLSDMLLCYLVMLHFDIDFPALAKILNIGESRFISNISRVRPILNEALSVKWKSLLPRPGDDVERRYPAAALLIDCHTTECFRPKGRFGDAKTYYDGKNCIYGVKSELAVTAARPHFFVTSTPHEPGSTHDYTIHKRFYHIYLDFLRKRRHEAPDLQDPAQEEYWPVIVDKGYIGPAADTPDERRITPRKNAVTQTDIRWNQDVGHDRVPIEQFLGRLCKLFAVFRNVYRYDHSNFDVDFANACLLTNEAIVATELVDEDATLYRQILAQRVEKHSNEVKKRKAAQERWKKNKSRRLDKVDPTIKGDKKD
jgi:hypothetical protein